MTSRVKVVLFAIIILLVALPFISNKGMDVNVAKDNIKVAELGGYKIKKIKDILEPNKISIFHYYSKDCLACDRQHLELMNIKKAGLKDINIIGIGSSSYSEYKKGSERDAYKDIYWDAYDDIAKKMQIIGTPTIFLVNSDGKVLKKTIGYIESSDLLQKFNLEGNEQT